MNLVLRTGWHLGRLFVLPQWRTIACGSLLLSIGLGPRVTFTSATAPIPPANTAAALLVPIEFAGKAPSRVTLRGNATLSSWSSVSKAVTSRVSLAVKGTTLARWLRVARHRALHTQKPPVLPLANAPIATLSIPVYSLDGGNSGMNHDMWAALKARQHPYIRYQFRRVTAASIDRDPKGGQLIIHLKVQGRLTLAGATHKLLSHLIIRPGPAGGFTVHAASQVFMSDYGVTPPTAFFGLIRGHNRVRITFDLTMHRVPVALATARK